MERSHEPTPVTEPSARGIVGIGLWFPPVDISLGFEQLGRPPALVMVASYSQVITAMMLPSRQSPPGVRASRR